MAPAQTLLFDIPPAIERCLRSGKCTRWGGLIRLAPGQPDGGAIVAHLKEVGPSVSTRMPGLPTGAPAKLLSLGHVAAAASVLNLGVSVAGFAIMNAKLNALQRSISDVESYLRDMEWRVSGRLDHIDRSLVELHAMAALGLDALDEGLEHAQAIEYRKLHELAAMVMTQLEYLTRGAPAGLESARQAVTQVRLTLRAELAGPPRSHRRWPLALFAFRIWLQAVMVESVVLRMSGETRTAVERMAEAARLARQEVSRWREVLFPEELGGVFALGHSAFDGRVPEEMQVRLARAQLEEPIGSVEQRERQAQAAERVARGLPGFSDDWQPRLLTGGSVLDMLEELTERTEAREWELRELYARRIAFDAWEGAAVPSERPMLQIVTMEG